MWSVVYIADGEKQIQMIMQLLQAEGILCRVRYLGKQAEPHVNAEILVPESEVEEASLVIHENIF